MGYELTYKYHKKTEDGYDTDKVDELKKKVGDPFEDVPLEKLAATIMMQLARRDIWVVDVEITELSKKKIKFRETEGGIVIKNKKFTLDSIAGALESHPVQEAPSCPAQLPSQHPHEAMAKPTAPVPTAHPHEAIAKTPAPSGEKAIRNEIFDPTDDMVRAGMVKGQFTRGKLYPIFKEEKDPREVAAGRELPMLYKTKDDLGKAQLVPSACFVAQGQGLVGGGQFDSDMPSLRGGGGGGLSDDGLRWDGVVEGGATDIR